MEITVQEHVTSCLLLICKWHYRGSVVRSCI